MIGNSRFNFEFHYFLIMCFCIGRKTRIKNLWGVYSHTYADMDFNLYITKHNHSYIYVTKSNHSYIHPTKNQRKSQAGLDLL